MSHKLPEPLAHDHLDELESFFYVFARIIYAYDRNGIFHSLGGDLPIWEKYSDDQSTLAICKRAFIVGVTVPRAVSERWPKECLDVFHRFRAFVKCFVHKKLSIVYEIPADAAETLKLMWSNFEDHYNHVLGLFDEGIATLEKGEAEKQAAHPADPRETSSLRPPRE